MTPQIEETELEQSQDTKIKSNHSKRQQKF